MEKRLIVAVLLSFAVLYLWGGLAPNSKRLQQSPESTQSIDNKDVTRTLADVSFGGKEVLEKRESLDLPATPPIIERIKIIETDKLVVKFSNIGGVIKGVKVKEYDRTFPLTDIMSVQGFEDVEFEMTEAEHLGIVFKARGSGVEITKRFDLSKDDYTIRSEIEVTGSAEMSNLRSVVVNGFKIDMSNLDIPAAKGDSTNARDKSLNEYIINTNSGIKRKASAYKFTEKENEHVSEEVNWIGFRDRYYCALIKPGRAASGYSINYIDKRHLSVGFLPEDNEILDGKSKRYASIIYVGPENLDLLKEYKSGFERVRRYYRFGLFDAIAKVIYQTMHILHKIIPNWGVSIILISILIYFSMYPLTMKSMMSMKKMQAIQPKLLKLKEKNKNNPQKLNKEMMELYKENKVNPLGGCLPMLFQMPVFIGLYQVLWRDVSFKGAKFLWIQDLSQPDRLFIFPFNLPFLGNEFNLLPVLMIVVMFFQMKLSSKNMVVSDPSQAAQQKMMGTIMPVFMGVIFYKFASGLTLYFTMFYIFSTFTQWKMSKTTGAVA